ncbi:MAG: right-handed parallel beta-helix repeat-containing protein [Halobaculum sp.]
MPSRDSGVGRVLAVVLSVLFVVIAGGVAPALAQESATGTPTPTGTPSGIVVDASGGGDYETISAAVRAADPGETITVRSGVYTEQVRLNKTVTLVAPNGAILDGRGMQAPDAGITITGDAEPTVRGFTIVGYQRGVSAADTSGNWKLRRVTIRNSSFVGVYAAGSSGNWSIRDAAIYNSSAIGVGAFRTSGDWEIVRATIQDTTGVAVNARYSSGSWTIRGVIIENTTAGSKLGTPWSGTAIYAGNTSGPWTVTESAFQNNAGPVIDATGADPPGNATGNFWTSGDPTADGSCVGAVDCGDTRSTPPLNAGFSGNQAPIESSDGGGGLPLTQIAVVIVALLAVVGVGFLLVLVVGVDEVITVAEGLIGQVLALVGVIDTPSGGGGTRTIALANVDSETVTCRVQCRTNDGVQFQYDLTLKGGEQREAKELPGSGPFEISVQVDDADVAETFEQATDVIVRVVAGDAEVVAA